MPSLTRRTVAEMFGTFALVFFGCGVVVMDSFPGARAGLLGIALVHAIVLSIAVSATMFISGAHLNPAITIGMLAIRKITPRDALAYIVGQLAAALLAIAVARMLLPVSIGDLVSWGTPALSPRVTFQQGIAIEALLTFFLMSAVMATAVAPNAPKIGGFGIGLTLFFTIMVGGPLTGSALNPARAFGPAIISGNMTAQAVWWIGPIIGCVIAALLWQHVLLRENRSDEPAMPTEQ
ncbi:MAG TPA: aquaporin [Gemmatimonadales bacterium]|nr:aquaporin [Gemmatimonadales bacterium]